MPTPGFSAGTLDKDGCPAWITGLDNDDNTNRTVHVVRGLLPADALQVVGARSGVITPCRLPGERPDAGMSLPRAAIGPTDSGAVLLAGQVGAWTFIYDDAGMTCIVQDGERGMRFVPTAKLMSAGGREAATSTGGISLNDTFAYAVDGELLFQANDDEIDPADDDIPAGLRAAIHAAGDFASGDDEDDEIDCGICMRVLCALAGLNITVDDLRKIPLLAAPFS